MKAIYRAKKTKTWFSIYSKREKRIISYWNKTIRDISVINKALKTYKWEDPVWFLKELFFDINELNIAFQNEYWEYDKPEIEVFANLANTSYYEDEQNKSIIQKIKDYIFWEKKKITKSLKFMVNNKIWIEKRIQNDMWLTCDVYNQLWKIVVSFRWTDWPNDLLDNAWLVFWNIPEQLRKSSEEIITYIEKFRWREIFIVWHSLWWALAKITHFLFYEPLSKAISFNAPWVEWILLNSLSSRDFWHLNESFKEYIKDKWLSENEQWYYSFLSNYWNLVTRIDSNWASLIEWVWTKIWKWYTVKKAEWHSLDTLINNL